MVMSRRPLSGTEKSKWYRVLAFAGPAPDSTVVCVQVWIDVQFGNVPVVPAGQTSGGGGLVWPHALSDAATAAAARYERQRFQSSIFLLPFLGTWARVIRPPVAAISGGHLPSSSSWPVSLWQGISTGHATVRAASAQRAN